MCWRRRGGAAKRFEDPTPVEHVRPTFGASPWWPEARPEQTPHGRLGCPTHEHLVVQGVPHLAKLWPGGPHVQRLLASAGKQVDSDRHGSRLGFSLSELECGHTDQEPPEDA